MSFLEKNISHLEKNPLNKSALEKLTSFKNNGACKYNLSKTKTGDVSLSYEGKYITSSFNPKADAQKFVETVAPKKDKNYNSIFISASSLHHVSFFAENYDYENIIIIEKDVSLIHLIFSEKDFPFLKDSVLFLDEYSENIANMLDLLIDDICAKRSVIFSHPRACLINKDYYARISESVGAIMRKKIMSLTTYYYHIPLWSKNIIYNSLHNNGFSVSSFNNILLGNTPIVIIGGGASLDTVAEKIRELEETHFILSLSNALSWAAENGIKPDAVISTDGGFYSSQHLFALEYAKEKNIMLFTTHSAYPYPFYSIDKENIFYFSQGESFEKELFKDSMLLPMEGSVLNTAYRLSSLLSPSYIILAGCDFSYSDEKTHSAHSMSFYSDYKNQNKIKSLYTLNSVRQNACDETVFDYKGKKHKTSISLIAYYKHFENLVSSLGAQTFSLTETSAKLKGVDIYKDKHSEKKEYSVRKEKEKIYFENVHASLKEYKCLTEKKDIDSMLAHRYSDFIAPWHKERALEYENLRIDFFEFSEKWCNDVCAFSDFM